MDDDSYRGDAPDEAPATGDGAVSRRQFLKMAGAAGAAVGLGAGLGGLVAACGGDEETTTTAGATSTTAGATTTASAGPEAGRELKVGFVDALTGALADFGVAGSYCAERWREYVADGLVCGDGKKHPVTIVVEDSQSDTARAASVAAGLITDQKCDFITAAASPDTVNPVADQCEAMGTPCLTVDSPMESYFFGRNGDPANPFKWTYHIFWGMWEISDNSFSLWDQVDTNKKVAVLWPNNVDGNAYRAYYPDKMAERGYTMVDGGSYNEPSESFATQINLFKREGCEVVTGVIIPPDCTNFWTQAKQQGFNPKVAEFIKPTLFPAAMEALGELGDGLLGPMWFHPTFPFKSSLTGETAKEMCDDFEKRKNMQWQQPILHYVVFEWVVDVLKRTTNVDDKEEIMKKVAETNMPMTIAGPIDFTAPLADRTKHVVPNVAGCELYGGQWRLSKGGKYMYDLFVCSNAAAPSIPVQDKVKPLA
ncbi:MAG: ABC transporter substrate-binding protein [Actinomycetia bacterium]|nr:ABC transporter substrate-binding protein [Actinomycetes bacterium]